MPENKTQTSRSITKVTVTGAEKKYKPNKHYVFIIQVTHSDDTEYIIYRKYSDFYKFQTSLLDKFPIEAGDLKEPRIIPYLPGRRPFARDKRKLAEERQGGLDKYCRDLITLKDNVSKSVLVKQFFEAKPTDIEPVGSPSEKKWNQKTGNHDSTENEDDDDLGPITGPITLEPYQAIADYKANDKTEMSLVKDQILEVVEKSDNGWWMVQIDHRQGWAPATYLQPMDLDEEVDNPEPIYGGEPHLTLAAHVPEEGDELRFEKGIIVDVLHKNLDGWWVASYNGTVGYAPASYLQRYNDTHLKPTESVKKRRHQVTKTIVPKRKTILDPSIPRADLSIYKSMAFSTDGIASGNSGSRYGNVENDAAEDEAIYENPCPLQPVMPTGIKPHNTCDDDPDVVYGNIEDDGTETYVNLGSEQNGIMRPGDVPPIPPPKDYKPELPPKAIVTPTLPPKIVKVRKQTNVVPNGNSGHPPEKPVRRKRKDDPQNRSPNFSHPPTSNFESLSHSPVLQNEQKFQNVNDVPNNRNNGIACDSELLKKLEARRRKNEQLSQTNEIPKHNTIPDVQFKTLTITPTTPKLPQRAGRQDDRPMPLPRTVAR